MSHPLLWMAGAASAWFALVLVSPVEPAVVAFAVYGIGSRICHQIADRSFHLGEVQLAVCARCVGIYAGAALSLLWQLAGLRAADLQSFRPLAATPGRNRLWLLGGGLPTVVTVALEQSGVWAPSNLVRAISGAPLGIAVTLVAGCAATLHYEQWRQRRLV